MSEPPQWLPALVPVSPWSASTYDELYAVFCHMFNNGPVSYRGHRVVIPRQQTDGKEDIFWHITSRKFDRRRSDERHPDTLRSERLSWLRSVIERCPCPSDHVFDWDYEEGDGTIKTYIWLQDWDFLVILKKFLDGNRLLITSFHVDNAARHNEVLKKWENRLNP
jgi:hypothetical protein